MFEVDRPGPQAWKKRRLGELGFALPDWLRFVPVDFEAGQSWVAQLQAAGFEAARPAVVVSTGVSMYLTREANAATLRQAAARPPGSTFRDELSWSQATRSIPSCAPGSRWPERGRAQRRRSSVSPRPAEILAMAREAGFKAARHVSSTALADRYFAGRADGFAR